VTEYGVIYEQAGDGSWSASAVDLPVFAVGDTKEEAEREIRSAIAFHLEFLADQGEHPPKPASSVGTVTV
jgi:predicted RNase H-like HicB family nuclease